MPAMFAFGSGGVKILACRAVGTRVFTKQIQLGESGWKFDSPRPASRLDCRYLRLRRRESRQAGSSNVDGQGVLRKTRATVFMIACDAENRCEKSSIISGVPAGWQQAVETFVGLFFGGFASKRRSRQTLPSGLSLSGSA